MQGYVYFLSNPSMPEDMLKIGMTKHSPEERARALSNNTSVPIPFKVEFAFQVAELSRAEYTVHNALSEYRVSDKREFFQIDIINAVEMASNALERYKVEVIDIHDPEAVGKEALRLIAVRKQAEIIGERIDKAAELRAKEATEREQKEPEKVKERLQRLRERRRRLGQEEPNFEAPSKFLARPLVAFLALALAAIVLGLYG
jgi:hypothetical protein